MTIWHFSIDFSRDRASWHAPFAFAGHKKQKQKQKKRGGPDLSPGPWVWHQWPIWFHFTTVMLQCVKSFFFSMGRRLRNLRNVSSVFAMARWRVTGKDWKGRKQIFKILFSSAVISRFTFPPHSHLILGVSVPCAIEKATCVLLSFFCVFSCLFPTLTAKPLCVCGPLYALQRRKHWEKPLAGSNVAFVGREASNSIIVLSFDLISLVPDVYFAFI